MERLYHGPAKFSLAVKADELCYFEKKKAKLRLRRNKRIFHLLSDPGTIVPDTSKLPQSESGHAICCISLGYESGYHPH